MKILRRAISISAIFGPVWSCKKLNVILGQLCATLVQFWKFRCIFGSLTFAASGLGYHVNFGATLCNFGAILVQFWCNFGATFGNFWCIFGSLTLDFDQNTVLRPIFLRCFRFRLPCKRNWYCHHLSLL